MTPTEKEKCARFGKLIRRRRMEIPLKQFAVATMCGIDRRTLANIEWGRHFPSLLVYFKLARVLQMDKPAFSVEPNPKNETHDPARPSQPIAS